jgi:hypothetical protein
VKTTATASGLLVSHDVSICPFDSCLIVYIECETVATGSSDLTCMVFGFFRIEFESSRISVGIVAEKSIV